MIAVRHNGEIAIAADSQWSSGSDKFKRNQPKIFQKDGFIMTCGPCSGFELVFQEEILLTYKEFGNEWSSKWPIRVFNAKNESALRRLADNDAISSILVIWDKKFFQVYSNGSIFEASDNIVALGCGEKFSKGAATILIQQEKTAKDVAVKAAKVACKLSTGCSLPVICKVIKDD